MVLRKFTFFSVSFLVFSLFSAALTAESKLDSNYTYSWSDLDEHAAKRIYGSEREEKFPVRNPLFQIENWKDHYAFNLSLIFKYTNYPKFKSYRFLFPPAPLFYRLSSKVDNRKKTWLFPVFYSKKYGSHSKIITPLGFSDHDADEWDKSFLYLFYFGADKAGTRKTIYHSLFPLYHYTSSKEQIDGKNIKSSKIMSPLIFSRKEKTCETKCEIISSLRMIPILPFLYYSRTERAGTHHNF